MGPYTTGAPYPLDSAAVLARAASEERFVLLETARVAEDERRSYLFTQPARILTADGPDDVDRLHAEMDAALAEGFWLAGYWTYEWGYALEPALHRLLARMRPRGPLVWLGAFPPPRVWTHAAGGAETFPGAETSGAPPVEALSFELDRARYIAAVERLKAHIAAGDTYQVNFTFKCAFTAAGSPCDLYAALRARQAAPYGGIVRAGERWVLSLSPELFLKRDGARIWSRPMKGTSARGRTTAEDAARARALAEDPKSRAENIMIVDLLRNDIGRLAAVGSVRPSDLFRVERYETLFQMTSRIEGRLGPHAAWGDIFRALFPCGSVTGAPKIRTMELIAANEPSPRGVYTGALGYIAPDGRAALDVAIRTVVLDGARGELGIGSGITAGSDPAAEYEECLLKAEFLARPAPEFALIETLRWDRASGYAHLDRHCERLADSAHYFGFPFDAARVRDALGACASTLGAGQHAQRVRLLLDRTGAVSCATAPIETDGSAAPPRAALHATPIDSRDRFLYHKTTHRALYDAAAREARARGLLDYLFVNERGELAEGAVTNIFIEKHGALSTPPLASGLLPGTLRAELLAAGRARERVLFPRDIETADAVFLGNSVRGLVRVTVVGEDEPRPGADGRAAAPSRPAAAHERRRRAAGRHLLGGTG